MPWIIKTVLRLPTDSEDRVEYFGSGDQEEAKAVDHVRRYVPDAEIGIVCAITEAELLTYGVPQGRTEMIRFDEAEHRRRRA